MRMIMKNVYVSPDLRDNGTTELKKKLEVCVFIRKPEMKTLKSTHPVRGNSDDI